MSRSNNHRNNPFDDDTTIDDVGGGSASVTYSHHHPHHPHASATAAPHDPLLDTYEHKLQTSIDPDFFDDPSQYQALNRVIEIIGAGIGVLDHTSSSSSSGGLIGTNHEHIPKYQQMKRQQLLVEEAIEHMAIKHCADLNSSVAAVGRMSRQFDEAKLRVRNLRRQVRDVKDSLRLGELGMGDLVRFFLFAFVFF
jgi:hypothetical protein